ncbi:MAG TPA: Ger(x)C family spore germination protein, partial [Clostridiales bacterium]|nr:Ger(x)C family spore germination protein [Clostridiales bacterium]
MQVKDKKPAVLTLLILSFFLSGCWDHIDIEQRGYVLGVAIDAYPPVPMKDEEAAPGETPPEEEVKLELMETHTGQPLYAMTIQLPILRNDSQPSDASSAGSGGGSLSWEITQVGNSFICMSRQMLSRSSLALYYEHLQAIIISDRVARQGISNVLNFFTRDPEMRRRVRVYISQGEAKAVLDVKPRVEEYSSIYLAEMPTNATKSSRIVHHTDLGQVIQLIHNNLSFVLPIARPTKDEIKISGAAAFKGDKMVGWVSELETEAIKLLRNLYEGGIVTVQSPEQKGAIEVLDVTKTKTKITPVIRNDEIAMYIKIDVKGNYAEYVNKPALEDITIDFLDKLEQEFEKEIARNCTATINKFQEEYKADVFHFC